jgi:hypothetical protein
VVEGDLQGDVGVAQDLHPLEQGPGEQGAVGEHEHRQDLRQLEEQLRHVRHQEGLPAGDADPVNPTSAASRASSSMCAGSSSRRATFGPDSVRQ